MVERHGPLLLRIARQYSLCADDAQDAYQRALEIYLRRVESLDPVTEVPWLKVVAIHEAYRLSAIDRRDARLERLSGDDGDWHEVMADPRSLDDAIEALEALRALAALPERRRIDLALKVAGYSYEEIRAQTPGRTRTNVISGGACRCR